MPPLTLVVVAKDQAGIDAFDKTHVQDVELVLIANSDREPLARIGNRYLHVAPTPVIGLVHADTWYGPGALAAFTDAAFRGAVCGLVGIDINRVYHWSKDNPGPVSTLDSCSVFLRRDCGLRFDETLCNSFHLHVEDLCLQAQQAGIPVIVPSANADHLTTTFDQPEWQKQYWMYRERLAQKWSRMAFRTT